MQILAPYIDLRIVHLDLESLIDFSSSTFDSFIRLEFILFYDVGEVMYLYSSVLWLVKGNNM